MASSLTTKLSAMSTMLMQAKYIEPGKENGNSPDRTKFIDDVVARAKADYPECFVSDTEEQARLKLSKVVI